MVKKAKKASSKSFPVFSRRLQKIAEKHPAWKVECRELPKPKNPSLVRTTLVRVLDFYRRQIAPKKFKRVERIKDYRIEASVKEVRGNPEQNQLSFSFAYPMKPYGGSRAYNSQRVFMYFVLRDTLREILFLSPSFIYGEIVTYPDLKWEWARLPVSTTDFSFREAIPRRVEEFVEGLNKFLEAEHVTKVPDGREFVWGALV